MGISGIYCFSFLGFIVLLHKPAPLYCCLPSNCQYSSMCTNILLLGTVYPLLELCFCLVFFLIKLISKSTLHRLHNFLLINSGAHCKLLMWVSSLDKFCFEPHVMISKTKALAEVLPHHFAYCVNSHLHARGKSPMEGSLQCQYNEI